MIMKKILKNNTASTMTILNRDIATSDQYDIPYGQWLKLSDNIKEEGDVYTNILSGDIVVNDGYNDLSIIEGLKLCEVLDFQDHHSCMDYIDTNEELLIEERRQMIVHDEVVLDGDIIIDGTLILE